MERTKKNNYQINKKNLIQVLTILMYILEKKVQVKNIESKEKENKS
mgnify:CR=1